MATNRKSNQNTRAQVILLIGFCVAGLLEMPAELFWALAAGLGVNQGSFMWGNVQEWKAREGKPNADKAPPTPMHTS